jgi:malate dehydrogenase (oxaloacetate-decarboxylating)
VTVPTSAQYSVTLRTRIAHRPGMLGRVAVAIGEAGGSIGAVDLVSVDDDWTLRDIDVDTSGTEQARAIRDAVGAVDGVEVVDLSDRTFNLHLG